MYVVPPIPRTTTRTPQPAIQTVEYPQLATKISDSFSCVRTPVPETQQPSHTVEPTSGDYGIVKYIVISIPS